MASSTVSKIKKLISYIIPPVITVGLCYVLYADVDFNAILAQAATCRWDFFAAFLLCNVAAMMLRGLRWRLQLRPIGVNPPAGVMFRSIFGTYAVNIVFPRLGEFWRSAYIARVGSAQFSEVFGSMVADRLADTITVLLISVPTLLLSAGALNNFLHASGTNLTVGALLTSWPVLVLLGLGVLFVLYVWLGKGSMAQKVRAFLLNMWRGFAAIARMPRKGLWLLLTCGIWGFYILSMYTSMLAFAPTADVLHSFGFGAAMLTFVFGSLAMGIPSQGGIGPWQFAVQLSLTKSFGMDAATALAFATINLGATMLLTIALGLYTFLHILIRKQ